MLFLLVVADCTNKNNKNGSNMKNVPLNKVGGTLKQPTGYKAYIPNKLYPNGPVIQFDAELFKLVSEAERALGELKSIQDFLPDKDFVYKLFC